MAQTLPLRVQLLSTQTGLTLTHRVLNLDGTQFAAATTGLAETAVAGQYTLPGGYSAPDAGGYVEIAISAGALLGVAAIDPAASSLTEQDVIDALTTYDAATGADITALGATASITVISVVEGDDIGVYRNDTWSFSMTLAGITLTDYEAVAFVVKSSEDDADNDALLYVRSDTGLQRIEGAAPAGGSGAGSLTVNSATAFSVLVSIAETDVPPGKYYWWLKVFDTTPAPDQGYTRAKGAFSVREYGLRAIA